MLLLLIGNYSFSVWNSTQIFGAHVGMYLQFRQL